MHRIVKAALVAVLLPLPSCSDPASPGSVVVVPQADRSPDGPIGAALGRAVAVYEIDAAATGARGGLMGFMVEAAVAGSTLRLRSDMTYVGMQGGKRQSEGTWALQDRQLVLDQTHAEGRPERSRGTGRLQGRTLTIHTNQHGMDVTLVFRRRAAD